MSEYKRYIDELKLDEQFKDDLLKKMCAKQSDLQNIAETAGCPAPVRRSRRKFFGVLSAAACAVLACLVIVPVVVLTGPAASRMDGANSDFLAPPHGGDGSPSDDAQEAVMFALGQRASDIYGNYFEFSSIDCTSEVTFDDYHYVPSEGNVFVTLDVALDITHAQSDDKFIQLSCATVSASYDIDVGDGNYSGDLVFREDIFNRHFPADEYGRAVGAGTLVFETGESFLRLFDMYPVKEGEIFFECSDFRSRGNVHSQVLTGFELSLAELIANN